jgi:carbamate kinase
LKPSKPIGPFYEKEKADKAIKESNWNMVEDAGRGWRRVVASPLPLEIIEQEAVQKLVDADMTVIAVGGGGIPVIKDEKGDLFGTAAVIDKDFASALLAANLKADLFVISTAVEKAALNYKKPDQSDIDVLTLSDAKKYLNEGHFAAGSMGPKVKAVVSFLEQGGKEALITDPASIKKALAGRTGTRIVLEGQTKLTPAKMSATV